MSQSTILTLLPQTSSITMTALMPYNVTGNSVQAAAYY